VTPFALTAASLFHALREATGQSDLSMSVVSDIRRPPFERTIGQFAEIIILNQRAGGLDDDAVRALGADIIKGMRSYLPSSYLEDRLDWLRKRRTKGHSMTDVDVNYLPLPSRHSRLTHSSTAAQPSSGSAVQPMPRTSGPAPPGGYRVSNFLLTAQEDTPVPYYGVVLSWLVRPGVSSLSGFLRYESGLVSPQLAQTMVSAFVAALSGGASPAPADADVPDGVQVP
jgi:hypothetical protein